MWTESFDELVRAQLRLPAGQRLVPGLPLADHGLDSKRTMMLLVEIEQAYGVTFPDELLVPETFATADSLWTALCGLTHPAESAVPADG